MNKKDLGFDIKTKVLDKVNLICYKSNDKNGKNTSGKTSDSETIERI